MRSLLVLTTTVAALPNGVTKVLELLEAHQKKVIDNGNSDAEAYNEFSCFCRDTGKDKRAAIDKQKEAKMEAESEMTLARGDLAKEQGNRDNSAEELMLLSGNKKRTEEEKKETLGKLDRENMELSEALAALTQAIERLRASDVQNSGAAATAPQEEFLQVVQKVEKFGYAYAPAAYKALLQAAPAEAYGFHSDEIIKVLEDLHKEFKEEHLSNIELRANESKRFTSELQMIFENTNVEKKKNKNALAEIGRLQKKIGTLQGEFTALTAGILDNTEYLRELIARCDKVKVEWDAKVTTRIQEITALKNAIDIISTSFSDSGPTEAAPTFIQVRKVVQQAKKVVHTTSTVRSHRFGVRRAAARDPREDMVEMLNNAAVKFHSPRLAAIATAAQADPFKKVKTLIVQLIDRLRKEASGEQDEQNFCVTNIKKQETSLENSRGELKELNKILMDNRKSMEKYKEAITNLELEVYEVNDTWHKASVAHEKQTKLNDQTVKDSEDGHLAIGKARDTLKEFYDTAPAAKKDEGNSKKLDDAPDAGFSFGTNKENMSAAEGIFAMLEVIDGDMQMASDEAKRLQKEMDAEHADLKALSEKTLKEKEKMYDSLNTQHKEGTRGFNESLDSYNMEVTKRDNAIVELRQLDKRCNDPGMSYGERKAAREAEVAGLKEVIAIFEEYDQ